MVLLAICALEPNPLPYLGILYLFKNICLTRGGSFSHS